MRTTTLVATAVSVLAVLAACDAGGRPGSTGREDDHEQTDSAPRVSDTTSPQDLRPVTYSDDHTLDRRTRLWRIRTIQYGDRTIDPGFDAVAIDLTDDGLALVAADGGVHFTDGSSMQRLGDVTIEDTGAGAVDEVVASASEPLLAWFTPLGPDRSLVVYDTDEHREVAEVPASHCGPYDCQLEALVGDRVYWSDSPDSTPASRPARAERPLNVWDIREGTVARTDNGALWEDLRSYPRGFVKGDAYDTGEVVTERVNTEAVFFVPRGSSLELSRWVRATGADVDGDGEGDGEVTYGYGGFDTAGRRLSLQLPAGYTPAEETPYALFQWLDDDRFAVMAGAVHHEREWATGLTGYGDILVCDIARERCTLAVPGRVGDGFRLLPNIGLPN